MVALNHPANELKIPANQNAPRPSAGPKMARTPGRSERGYVSILMPILLIVFLGIAGLVIDYGLKYRAEQQLQGAADASALGGALDLIDFSAAHSNAATIYARNIAESNAPAPQIVINNGATITYQVGDDTVTVTTPYVKPGSSIPSNSLVHVVATRNVIPAFAPIVGITNITVSRAATAKKTSLIPDILVLDTNSSAACVVSGGAVLNLPDGTIVVDSTSDTALKVNGNGTSITANQISVAGSYSIQQFASVQPTPTTGQLPVADPLVNLPAPSSAGMTSYGTITISSGTATLNPGRYVGQITIRGGANVMLNPGIYYLEQGILVQGTATTISGSQVMLYNGSTDNITITAGGALNLSPPTSGTYAGITMFQARDNSRTVTLNGGANSILAGIYYFPSANPLKLAGNTGAAIGTVVTWQLQVTGGSFAEAPGGWSPFFYLALVD
jgi:Flp pilus assembly protein TadG